MCIWNKISVSLHQEGPRFESQLDQKSFSVEIEYYQHVYIGLETLDRP